MNSEINLHRLWEVNFYRYRAHNEYVIPTSKSSDRHLGSPCWKISNTHLKSRITHACVRLKMHKKQHTKTLKFLGVIIFQAHNSNFQALFKGNCQFSRQIEKSSTFQDRSQIQALFKVCGNHVPMRGLCCVKMWK